MLFISGKNNYILEYLIFKITEMKSLFYEISSDSNLASVESIHF